MITNARHPILPILITHLANFVNAPTMTRQKARRVAHAFGSGLVLANASPHRSISGFWNIGLDSRRAGRARTARAAESGAGRGGHFEVSAVPQRADDRDDQVLNLLGIAVLYRRAQVFFTRFSFDFSC
jgi:hypothetical protein